MLASDSASLSSRNAIRAGNNPSSAVKAACATAASWRAPGGAGGWYAQTFRPERVTLGADGAPNFSEAFGERIPLETDAENPNLDHNWLALAPDPSVTTENPYPSDARGRYALAGTHRTYKALVYSTNERGRGGVDREVRTLGLRRATFVVQDAHTRDAELVSAEFDGAWVPFEVNGTRNGLADAE